MNYIEEFIKSIEEDILNTKLQLLVEDGFWSQYKLQDHYNKHVTPEGVEWKPFPVRCSDGRFRILFPNMTEAEYRRRADDLMNTKINSSVDPKNLSSGEVIGWETNKYEGSKQPYAWVKFRLCELPGPKEHHFIEYVLYEPVFADKTIVHDEGSYKWEELPIKFEKVLSHGICDASNGTVSTKLFPKRRDLPLTESCETKLFKLSEELLTEANRQQLLQKSRNAQNYKNQSKGKNRYDRRTKSSISATVRDYNMIQMDPLFKRDILEFKIPVIGETDVYTVDIRVDGLLEEVRKQVMANKGLLEFKVVLQSLMKVLNVGNVYIGCNCPDAQYRMAYQQTKNDYKAGYKERRPSDITNPNDTLGAGCKHVLLVLANLDWAVKVASVVNNYIKYCRLHLESNYAEYIFPKIYGVKYDKAVQMNLFDTGLLPDDEATMKAVIDQGMQGKDKFGRFAKGNDMRFQKKELEEPEIPEEPADQMHIDLDNPEDVEAVDLLPPGEE